MGRRPSYTREPLGRISDAVADVVTEIGYLDLRYKIAALGTIGVAAVLATCSAIVGNKDSSAPVPTGVPDFTPTSALATATSEVPTAMPLLTPSVPAYTATPEVASNWEPSPLQEGVFADLCDDGLSCNTVGSINANIVLVYNDSGPLGYINGDEQVLFDQKELAQKKTKAIETGIPQSIVTIMSAGDSPDFVSAYQASEEKPMLSELPADVVSEKELERRKIKIINTPGEVKLWIRESAFQEEGVLEYFDGDQETGMIIVLVDGPVVDRRFLNDPVYDDVRDALPDMTRDLEVFRAEKIRFFSELVDYYKEALANCKDPKERESIGDIIHGLDLDLQFYGSLSEDQLLLEMVEDDSEAAGKYFSPSSIPGRENALLFVAVGKGNKLQTGVDIYFDANGEFYIADFGEWNAGDFSPKTNQSHPNPDDFMLNPLVAKEGTDKYKGSYMYPYGGQTPGQILRHEEVHDEFLNYAREWRESGEDSNFSEFDTDMRAMEQIRAAYKKWKESGDDSGFCFVFRTRDGKYILTQKEREPGVLRVRMIENQQKRLDLALGRVFTRTSSRKVPRDLILMQLKRGNTPEHIASWELV